MQSATHGHQIQSLPAPKAKENTNLYLTNLRSTSIIITGDNYSLTMIRAQIFRCQRCLLQPKVRYWTHWMGRRKRTSKDKKLQNLDTPEWVVAWRKGRGIGVWDKAKKSARREDGSWKKTWQKENYIVKGHSRHCNFCTVEIALKMMLTILVPLRDKLQAPSDSTLARARLLLSLRWLSQPYFSCRST